MSALVILFYMLRVIRAQSQLCGLKDATTMVGVSALEEQVLQKQARSANVMLLFT